MRRKEGGKLPVQREPAVRIGRRDGGPAVSLQTTIANQSWRLGIVARVGGLAVLLTVAVVMMRAMPVPVPVPVSAQQVPPGAGEAAIPAMVEVEMEEGRVQRRLQEWERSPRVPHGFGYTPDIRFRILLTATGWWVVKEPGFGFRGCTGLNFASAYDGGPKCPSGECVPENPPTMNFWPNPPDVSTAGAVGHWSRRAATTGPIERLRSELVAELKSTGLKNIVVLSVTAHDSLKFGAIWPLEEMAQELLLADGQVGALEVEHTDSMILLGKGFQLWQVLGYAPPGYDR